MSQSSQPVTADPTRIVQIPSVRTNSLRAVFEAFGDSIVQLRAHGSVETTNTTPVDRQYALTREQQTLHRLTLDYEQLPGNDGPANPLSAAAREEILTEVECVLDTESLTVDPDLAVTSLMIRITDERLQEVTPAQSAEFDLYFAADPAEPPVREATKRLNADRGLYGQLGFNVVNLNLRSVIETETKHHQQSDGRYLSWGGPDDIRPRAPKRLAIRINDHVLPDDYGMLKPYAVVDDRVLEVAEDALTDDGSASIDGTSSTEGSQ